jgi:isochorismate synthase
VNPISPSLPALTTLSGRTREIDPARTRSEAGAPTATPYPRFTLETPDGDRITASGVAARLCVSGPDRFDDVRALLASLASSARLEGGDVDECLLAMLVFPFDSAAETDPGADLHRAWIPSRIEQREASGRARVIEWSAGDETPAAATSTHRSPWLDGGWSREGWTRAVETALERIRAGSVRKVVLARSRVVRGSTAFDTDGIFRALGDSYPACYRYRYESGDGSVFLGASPERLIALRSGQLEADAVAGTSGSEDGALLDDPKERLEHDIVVEEVLAALRHVADQVEADPAPSTHRLRNVTHLRTRIRAAARPHTHVLDVAARIHPSPAVAGAPRDAALELIRFLEPRPRGWYAGPIGWAAAGGDGELTLGLRAALTRGAEAILFAGAGIVLGSDPGREWEECETKMRAMEEALRG